MDKNYYFIQIIDLLNSVYNDESSCNEGSLDERTYSDILCLLCKLKDCDK